jgi:hypothetical protein
MSELANQAISQLNVLIGLLILCAVSCVGTLAVLRNMGKAGTKIEKAIEKAKVETYKPVTFAYKAGGEVRVAVISKVLYDALNEMLEKNELTDEQVVQIIEEAL